MWPCAASSNSSSPKVAPGTVVHSRSLGPKPTTSRTGPTAVHERGEPDPAVPFPPRPHPHGGLDGREDRPRPGDHHPPRRPRSPGQRRHCGCGCSDWRTDADMDAEHQADDFDYFPTGLYRSEWSENMKFDLDARAEAAEQARSLAAMRAARAKCRERFAKPARVEANPGEPSEKAPEPEQPKQPAPVKPADLGDPPFLRCPLRSDRGGEGRRTTSPPTGHASQLEPSSGFGPIPMPGNQNRYEPAAPSPPPRQYDLFVAASPNREHLHTGQPPSPPPRQ